MLDFHGRVRREASGKRDKSAAIREVTADTMASDGLMNRSSGPTSEDSGATPWSEGSKDEKPVAFGSYFLWGHGESTRGGPTCPECNNDAMCFFRKGTCFSFSTIFF